MSFISLHDILSKPELDLGFILLSISIISSGVVRVKLNSTSHGLPIYCLYVCMLVGVCMCVRVSIHANGCIFTSYVNVYGVVAPGQNTKPFMEANIHANVLDRNIDDFKETLVTSV